MSEQNKTIKHQQGSKVGMLNEVLIFEFKFDLLTFNTRFLHFTITLTAKMHRAAT